MSKEIDIVIKSCKKDFWLLTISLETLKKNVTGYRNVVLIIPEKDKHDFDTRLVPDRTLIHYIQEPEGVGGWIYQQVCKLNAYKYSTAEYIMFSDSDCFFQTKVNIQDLIKDGKPEILYTAWEDVGDAIVWKEPTSKFLKQSAEWEMMRRNNQIYRRSTLVALAEFEPQMEEIVTKLTSFSEFNVISSFAYQHEKEDYNFVNTADWTYVEPIAVQVWSHANKDGDLLHVKEYVRLLEAVMTAFNVPVPKP